MITEYLIYDNSVYGYMLAAIAERYIKAKYPKHKIVYWPNKTMGIQTHLVFPKDISKKDTVWILGQSPTPRGMIDLKSEIRPAKVYWYDYHTTLIDNIMADKESFGLENYPGLRTSKTILGQQMWSDLFPKEQIPPCVIWVDDFASGHGGRSAKAFFYGLTLIDADPEVLATAYSDTPDDFNNPANVWEECFKVKNPVNLDDPQREFEEDSLTRMTWDATFQLINMGSIIDTSIQLKTQDFCYGAEFKEYELFDDPEAEEGTKVALINDPALDTEVLRDYFTTCGSTYPYVGWYTIHPDNYATFFVNIVRLPEGKSAIEFAKKFDNASGDDNVARFQTNTLLYVKRLIMRRPSKQHNTNNNNEENRDE